MRMRPLMRWYVWVFAALLGFALQAGAAGVEIPPLKGRVTDTTGTLSAQNIARLEQKLAAFEQQKGVQVAVLMVPTVQPESIEEYAVRVFERWKLGRKRVDDGVLLVVAKNDRKLRIEVGYGLEGALNDATAKRIVSDDIVPHFKHGDFAAGIDAGVSRILKVVSGEPLPPPAAGAKDWFDELRFNPLWLFLAFVFANGLAGLLRRVVGRVLGAGVTGLLFGVWAMVLFGSVIVALVVGVFAFILGLAGGSSGGGWSSGGGSWSSGGGGFSSGGGFSGGGGSSGGGGASGSW